MFAYRATHYCIFLSFFLSIFFSVTSSTYLFQVQRATFGLITLNDTHMLGRSSLDEGSARSRDLFLIKHNTHKRQTSLPLAGFEPAIPTGERPQTHALDRPATGMGQSSQCFVSFSVWFIGDCHYS